MTRLGKVLLPIGILAVAGGGVAALLLNRKEPHIEPTPPKPTLVQSTTVATQQMTFGIRTQGTVAPLRETVLIPEVAGRIIQVSPSFEAGGFFEAGEVLLEIDPSNFESAVAQAEFNLAQAVLKLEQEKARADQARKEWLSLGKGEAPPLAVREPQLRAEESNARWAAQALERAKLDLARTKIRAPYAGMVREKKADLGQYVAQNTQLGAIFAIDVAEIRLPLSTEDLAYLELPYNYRGETSSVREPAVRLSARLSGRTHEWSGRIVRTEGTINTTNRMLYAVARVENPYARGGAADRLPLQIGLFVEAEIEGRTVDNVVVLPRQVLRGADRILVIDTENNLRTRAVEVLRTDERQVVISSGLTNGERVCTTALEFVVEGMKVKLVDSPAAVVAPVTEIADQIPANSTVGGAL